MSRGCADSPEIAVRHSPTRKQSPGLALWPGLTSRLLRWAAVFFTERLVHSTVPWTGKGERRKKWRDFLEWIWVASSPKLSRLSLRQVRAARHAL